MKTTILNLLFNIIVIQIAFCQVYFEPLNTPDSLDMRTVYVDLNQDIYIGNAILEEWSGLLKSVDNGNNWFSFAFENMGIGEIEMNEMDYIYASTGNDLYRSKNEGQSWEVIIDQRGGEVNSYPGGLLFASGSTSTYTNLLRSTDYGDTWQEVAIYSNVEFVKDIEIKNSDTIFVGTTKFTGDGGGVYCSVDGGDSWDHIGLTDHFVSSLALNSHGDLYAGTRGGAMGSGGVFVLPSGHDDWIELYDSDLVTSIVINAEDEIYIGCSNLISPWGGVRRSVDDGQTWEDISHPSMMIYCMDELVLDHEGYLYALVEDSPAPLYRSINPTTKVSEEIAEPGIITYNYPNPFTTKTQIQYKIQVQAEVSISVYNHMGQLVDSQHLGVKEEGEHKLEFNGSNFQAGIYYYSLCVNGIVSDSKKMILLK